MKSVKNFLYVEKTSAECNEDSYLVILHLSRVELHCKLQEKLHRVTWPLPDYNFFTITSALRPIYTTQLLPKTVACTLLVQL